MPGPIIYLLYMFAFKETTFEIVLLQENYTDLTLCLFTGELLDKFKKSLTKPSVALKGAALNLITGHLSQLQV